MSSMTSECSGGAVLEGVFIPSSNTLSLLQSFPIIQPPLTTDSVLIVFNLHIATSLFKVFHNSFILRQGIYQNNKLVGDSKIKAAYIISE